MTPQLSPDRAADPIFTAALVMILSSLVPLRTETQAGLLV